MTTVAPAHESSTQPSSRRAARRSSARDRSGVGQWRVVTAEWVKLVSLRSNVITLIASWLVVVGFAMLAAGVVTGGIGPQDLPEPSAEDRAAFTIDPTSLSMAGTQLAMLLLGSVGVLAMSGEHSSGMIRTTMAAVPRRLPVLWAKAIVLLVTAGVLMTVSVFAAFAVTQAILDGSAPTASLADDGVLRALLGNVGYLVGITLIGLALGTLLRSSAAGITTLFAALLVVPSLLDLILPDAWYEAVYPFLPSSAGQSFTSVDPGDTLRSMFTTAELLPVGQGAAVFCGWVVACLMAATLVLRRRDV